MDFQTPRETLFKGIQIVQNVAGGRTPLPILNNILIDAKKDRLKLTATDLEIGIISEVPAEVKKEGSITLPAKKFSDIIRELPDFEVHIEARKNNRVNIRSKKCLFRLVGLPKDEYPKLPEFENEEFINLEEGLLKKMLLMTAFAMSTDQARYVLNSVLFSVDAGQVKTVATDGRRLSFFTAPTREGKKLKKDVLIPAKTVTELLRNLKQDGTVKISFKKNQLSFSLGETSIVSRIVEGEFPDYEKVIPDELQEKMRAQREGLLMAVRRAALLVNPESPAVKLALSKDSLVITKTTPDVGDAREEMKVEYKGPPIEIGFNPTFIMDVLKNLEEETVAFEMLGADKPGVIRTNGNYVYVVLPIELV